MKPQRRRQIIPFATTFKETYSMKRLDTTRRSECLDRLHRVQSMLGFFTRTALKSTLREKSVNLRQGCCRLPKWHPEFGPASHDLAILFGFVIDRCREFPGRQMINHEGEGRFPFAVLGKPFGGSPGEEDGTFHHQDHVPGIRR